MEPEQLKQFRISRGWTQQIMAEQIGVNQSQISRWERGLQVIPDVVERLVECFEGRVK